MAVLAKYLNWSNIPLIKNAIELLENTKINEHTIELKEGQQSSFWPIYSLGPMELEMFKIYININLANSHIRLSKFLAGAPIFFNEKPDSSVGLCMDYWDFNNLIIKNKYPLFLIRILLDQIGRAKRFV